MESSISGIRCRCVHLLRSRTPTRLALVIVGTLALTDPGRPTRTCTDPPQPFFVHEVSTSRNLCLVQLTQIFFVIVLLSALPVLIPVRPNDDIRLTASNADFTLKSQRVMSSTPSNEIHTQFNALFSTFAILIVFSREPSSASCVVTATACSRGVVFPQDPSRNMPFSGARLLFSGHSLFIVYLLLLSDAAELG